MRGPYRIDHEMTTELPDDRFYMEDIFEKSVRFLELVSHLLISQKSICMITGFSGDSFPALLLHTQV